MGVPDRFAIEYPQRCLQLMSALDRYAHENQLVGSFSLLAAAAVLTIPFERMKAGHPLYIKDKDDQLTRAIKGLDKVMFLDAPFWQGHDSGSWFQTRVVNDINDSFGWKDEEGHRPLSEASKNSVHRRRTGEVLRPLRNALAHGNIFYLNAGGYEVAGDQMKYLGFASRYEEPNEDPDQVFTYRLIIVAEESFYHFVRAWAQWVSGLDKNQDISVAA